MWKPLPCRLFQHYRPAGAGKAGTAGAHGSNPSPFPPPPPQAREQVNRGIAALYEERRELMAVLRAMSAAGAGNQDGVAAGARLHANIAAESKFLDDFQAWPGIS